MTGRIIALCAMAGIMSVGLASCGAAGDLEQAAPPPPAKTTGAKPQNSVPTGPMPEAIAKKYTGSPMSPGAAKRNMATGQPSGGRDYATEARKLD